MVSSLPCFCLSDFYIIQKWIDYAKGLSDADAEKFTRLDIVYPEIYNAARNRKIYFDSLKSR